MFTSVVTIATGIVMWMLIGYSLSFGPDHGGVIGDFSWFGLEGVSLTEPYVEGQGIPNMVFCLFQMMFAVITPALITGSVAGRMKFKSLFVFLVLWSLVVYYPMAHMVWADGGFLAKIGSVDFAGGNVVHISSGITALTLCILLGKRYDYKRANYKIHNMPMVALGGIYPAVWLVRIQRWFCIGSRRFGSSRIRHNCRFLRSCNAVLDVL